MIIILENKKWSFSSVKLFETCPYAFYLHYIENCEEKPNALQLHGKFVHSLLEQYFKGELIAFELADKYEAEYSSKVFMRFPFYNMYKSFYDKTLQYLQNFSGIEGEVLGVEKELETTISGHSFIGYADLIIRDSNGINVIDHKSHGEWQNRKERTEYYRQLYLYAKCIKEIYGEMPYKLTFNRFRIPEKPLDEELFKVENYDKAISWFADSVEHILQTNEWECKTDKWYCNALCGYEECVYN